MTKSLSDQLVENAIKEAGDQLGAGSTPPASGEPMSVEQALEFLKSKGVDTSSGSALGAACYEHYSTLTGLPVSERDEEGHFPDPINELSALHYELFDDFQDAWSAAAEDFSVDSLADDEDVDDSDED